MRLHACEQYEMASACYRHARRLDPKSFRWPYYLAVAETAHGRKTEAIPAFRDALLVDPDYLPARLRLAEVLSDIGDWQESSNLLGEIVRKHPAMALAFYELSRVETAQGRPLDAMRHLRKACELFPQFGVAHYALAILYRDQGEGWKAQQEMALFREFRQQRPPLNDNLLAAIDRLRFDPKDHLSRGVQLLESGHLSEAIAEFHEALAQDPSLAEAHGNLLSAYLRLGDFAKAEEHYRPAIALDPNMYETHYNFGLLCSQLGKTEQAAAAFGKALDINPFYAEAHNNLAFVLANEGRLDEAVDHFESAIRNQPHYRDAHFNLGQILLMQGRTGEAIPHLIETTLVRDEQTPLFLFTLGQAYLQAGEVGKSLDSARQARQGASSFSQAALLAEIDKFLSQAQSSAAVSP